MTSKEIIVKIKKIENRDFLSAKGLQEIKDLREELRLALNSEKKEKETFSEANNIMDFLNGIVRGEK